VALLPRLQVEVTVHTKRIVAYSLAACLLAPMAGWTHGPEDDADSSHPAHWVKDSAITAAIKTRIAGEHLSSLRDIRVETDLNGVVRLSGTAKNKEEIEKAVEIARGTDGVVRVKNDIVVQRDER
jgi:hyperosmotically inducible periplasmic protein